MVFRPILVYFTTKLGERLGVNKSTIQRYEANGVDPKKNYLIISIADALETNNAWLLGISDNRKGDVISKCRLQMESTLELFLNVLEESHLEDNEKMIMTGILGCFMDMFGTITAHFDKAMGECRRIESDEELKKSLMKYSIGTEDISEKTYQQEMQKPVEDYKEMADCLLHISDISDENHFARMFEIRNAAAKRLADRG